MGDEATDAATIEQMALCVRYFDIETHTLREDFLTFAQCEATTGEALSKAFLANLRDAGINIDKMRGQGYEGASNMSGIHRGVQARIREVVPRAVYTHCKAHSLNLAIIHASKETYARNMMDTVQDIAFSFNYSAKRLLHFQENLSNDATTKAEMERRTKIVSLCETRWAARANALNTFRLSFPTIVETLEELEVEHKDSKASAYKHAVLQFSFIITLVAIEHILSGLAPLSQLLQKKSCDLVEAVSEAGVVRQQMSDERNDPAVWEALYTRAVEIAEGVGTEPSKPRGRSGIRQQHRPNAPAQSHSEFWKINMYLPFVDHLLEELQTRLLQDGERFKAQYLIPVQACNLTSGIIHDIYNVFQEDLPAEDIDIFEREIHRWKTKCEISKDKLGCIADTIAATNDELYPNVTTCLHILLCMPVSTASAERSFSTMRRLKTYLRATMTTKRLTGLGLMNIHRDYAISSEQVVDIFARRKERRLSLLFRT